MKIYDQNGKLTGAACNCCGKIVLQENGVLKEDFDSFKKEQGYFSKKDGTVHSFDLCEACYDRLTGDFRIPVAEEKKTELL